MCMKKHRLYRPKGLTKEEQKYVDAMARRELIMSIVVLVGGIIILAVICALTKQATSL